MAHLLVFCSCCFICSTSKILFSNCFCNSSDSFNWISRGPRDYTETENGAGGKAVNTNMLCQIQYNHIDAIIDLKFTTLVTTVISGLKSAPENKPHWPKLEKKNNCLHIQAAADYKLQVF